MHYRGWAGRTNGDLLKAAEGEFDALVTSDSNIPSQQAVARLRLAVVVLRAANSTLSEVAPLVPALNRLLRGVKPGRLYIVAEP